MRLLCFTLALAVFLLAGCTVTPESIPASAPVNTTVSAPTPTPIPQRTPLLRIAVFGDATTTNVWAIFDEVGADYWNDATQASYWPQLYNLAPPSLDLQPATAKGMPSSLECDSDICIATVALQPNLTWTDGSPFTADDIVFTVNTALRFRLGLNWEQAYNSDVLSHAEALDKATVKFSFNGQPTVADWYYGVLQGPIVNQAYWEPRIAAAALLLPDETLLPSIQELESEFSALQAQIDNLNLSLNKMAPASAVYQETTKKASRFQDELNSIANKIDKSRTAYETALAEAREALFELGNANEPVLGAWHFSSRIEGRFENQVNLGTPFGDSWFDSVQYITYPNELAAVQALEKNEVDIILLPDGLSAQSITRLEKDSAIKLAVNMTSSTRFLTFNHTNPYLAEPALHQALACMLDQRGLIKALNNEVAPLQSYVLNDFWRSVDASLPCAGETDKSRLELALEILKAQDYSWQREPTSDSKGVGLKNPEGNILPVFILLTPKDDPLRVETAKYIAQQAEILGLSLDVQGIDMDELLYLVYGSGGYDMAILGWHLGAYPSYLCTWFMPLGENPFAYNESKLGAACEALSQTSDLEEAHIQTSKIQSILTEELPLIPLYAELRTDAYRNVSYPFDHLLDGLSRLYGAPTLAIPLP